MKFPKHLTLYLTHNEHKSYYETLDDALEGTYRQSDWISTEQFLKSIETDSVWVLQWYPDTPVGSCRYIAAELEALMNWVSE